jgi:hypothetical protein
MLERGLAHPVLGPFVLIVLALLLSMVFLHVSDDGHGALGEFGAACVALTSLLGALLIARGHVLVGSRPEQVRGDRGPPVTVVASVACATVTTFSARSSPLRR